MITRWAQRLPWNIITSASLSHNVDPLLVGAIMQVESGGEQYTTRYEPHYRWTTAIDFHAKRLRITAETEKIHQMTSWGLMQLMGAVLRETGFNDHLPKACTPFLNVEAGCRHIASLLKRFPDQSDMIAAYNAGSPRKGADGKYSNQPYVDKVLGFLAEIKPAT